MSKIETLPPIHPDMGKASRVAVISAFNIFYRRLYNDQFINHDLKESYDDVSDVLRNLGINTMQDTKNPIPLDYKGEDNYLVRINQDNGNYLWTRIGLPIEAVSSLCVTGDVKDLLLINSTGILNRMGHHYIKFRIQHEASKIGNGLESLKKAEKKILLRRELHLPL